MDNKQLENILRDALFIDLCSRYCNGQNIKKIEVILAFEAQKKQQEEGIENIPNLTDEQKSRLKMKSSKVADAAKEYVVEALRCQNRLIE